MPVDENSAGLSSKDSWIGEYQQYTFITVEVDVDFRVT